MKLGILDMVHVKEGRNAADALRETTQLAQAAEAFGYTRFWVSEHHGSRMTAFSSPELLIAHLAASTSKIHVGSGGIMLPHYSAYKVAENFRLLEALHPGRVDLGLGRAPGGTPLSTAALQENKRYGGANYPQQVQDLIGYLHEAMPPGHPFERLLAAPSIQTAPEMWLLGSSSESAKIAAELGTAYAFAEFFGAPGGREAIRHYRKHFQPSDLMEQQPRALIATLAVCAETEEEAGRLVKSAELMILGLQTGIEWNSLPSVPTAETYPYSEIERQHLSQIRQRGLVGTPNQIKSQLLHMAKEDHADEILINSPIHDETARIRSYELIATAFGLS